MSKQPKDKLQQYALFDGKTVLVTGGTGTIGSEIVMQLVSNFNPKAIRILSNDENGLFNLQQELSSHTNVRFLFGDVRDKDRMRMACESVDIVFHAAALKHVPICEYNPFEAVRTNVIGTQNLVEAALLENVERFILISTDKAVNPTSAMGASKLLCEKLVVEACSYKGSRRTKFSCVRFGNVLGSRGSVTEVFKRQIALGEPVTVTSREMTRFIMLVSQAVSLVFKAVELAEGGETFILKMPCLRILDLAEVMIDNLVDKSGVLSNVCEAKIVGVRHGEKLHEELMTSYESNNCIEAADMFIVPSLLNNTVNFTKTETTTPRGYLSKNVTPLSKSEIQNLLKKATII